MKFGTVVCLDDLHREGQSLKDVVDELDRGFLVAAWIDTQHPQSGAVVDRSELVVLGAPADLGPGRGLEWLNEFDVDLDLVSGQLLFVAFPPFVESFVALGSREPVEV
ncbi:MAG: hypothetical protein WBM01_07275 [Mycobacterium sp.]